jgi:hypothetical protein
MFLTLGKTFLGSTYAFDGVHTQYLNRRTIPDDGTVVEQNHLPLAAGDMEGHVLQEPALSSLVALVFKPEAMRREIARGLAESHSGSRPRRCLRNR